MGNFPNVPNIRELVKANGTKVYIYFATKSAGDDYDPEEKNFIYTNMNPLVIKGYVTMISPEKLVWKQYGLQEMGAVEVLTESKYKNWFKICNKIVINDAEYAVFKIGNGNRVLIQDRPGNMIRVVLERKG